MSIYDYFANFAGITALTLMLVGIIKANLNMNKIWTQCSSWTIAMLLTFGASKIPQFNSELYQMELTGVLILGFINGLISNGIYDIKKWEPIQALIKMLRS